VRIAYFSPLPPHATGVASYSAKLLPHLARLVEVTVFSDGLGAAKVDTDNPISLRDTESFAGPLREGFDICVYQMGNNVRYHKRVYDTLLRFPGVTTLHDPNLNSFYGDLFMKRNRVAAYTNEMGYAYGLSGARHARRAQMGLELYSLQRYPLFDRIAHVSLGIVVHSRYAQRLVADRCTRTPVTLVNQPVSIDQSTISVEEAKTRLGFKPDEVLLASFGYIAPNKRIDLALEAFASIHKRHPGVRYALVGKVVNGYDLSAVVARLHLDDAVHIVGYADDVTFKTFLRATDIGINLRCPTLGETSATLLALMAAGKAALVSKVDAFVELPEHACVKIDVGPGELAQIEVLLTALIEDRDLRERVGANALAYIRETCAPAVAAARYYDFIQDVLGET
jgi:glycosyltransferase involved in cell wall biosynthesis